MNAINKMFSNVKDYTLGVLILLGAVWFFYIVALMLVSILLQLGGSEALSTSDILELSNPLRLFH